MINQFVFIIIVISIVFSLSIKGERESVDHGTHLSSLPLDPTYHLWSWHTLVFFTVRSYNHLSVLIMTHTCLLCRWILFAVGSFLPPFCVDHDTHLSFLPLDPTDRIPKQVSELDLSSPTLLKEVSSINEVRSTINEVSSFFFFFPP